MIKTWTRDTSLEYETITSFRTEGSGGSASIPSMRCEQKFTAKLPLGFAVTYKQKLVSHRVPIAAKPGRYRVEKVMVDFPYYTFRTETLSLASWKAIYKLCLQMLPVLKQLPSSKYIILQITHLGQRINKAGSRKNSCLRTLAISAGIHACSHERWYKPQDDPYPGKEALPTGVLHNFGSGSSDREFEHSSAQPWNLAALHVAEHEEGMLRWLWPSAGELEGDNTPDRPQPMIDLAEAGVSGTIIGKPPDLAPMFAEHLPRIKRLSTSISFAANSYLWKTLVIDPVISSAVALSASIVYKDMMLKELSKAVKSDEWVQGKSRPYFKDMKEFNLPETFSASTNIVRPNEFTDILTETYEHKGQAFGQLWYKLDKSAIDPMDYSSKANLGFFFQNLSSGMSETLYNTVALSFVFDMFSSHFARQFTVDNKVYLPLSEYKMLSSVKLNFRVRRHVYRELHYATWQLFFCNKGDCLPYDPQSGFAISIPTNYPSCRTCNASQAKKMIGENVERFDTEYNYTRAEERRHYVRWVSTPAYNADAALPPMASSGISNPNPGQWTTIWALIWTLSMS